MNGERGNGSGRDVKARNLLCIRPTKNKEVPPNEAEAVYRAHANKAYPSCIAQQSISEDEQVAESNSVTRDTVRRSKSD